MKKSVIGIVLFLFLLAGFTSCKGNRSGSKLVINEVLTDNVNSFEDDYGLHNGWIEVFNRSYGTENLAGCYLKASSKPGDTVTYFIPKGDVLTSIPPRRHLLFWADGAPRKGTFHANFVLSKTNDNWIGLYDSGRNLLDEVVIPGGLLKTDQSYARAVDGAETWEVKDDSEKKYVSPNANNEAVASNLKMDNFRHHDPIGIGMTITAMCVVFVALILLYICFRYVGKLAVRLRKRNAMKVHNVTDHLEAKERGFGEAPGEVIAAITMALHEAQGTDHDVEETVLTISRVKRSYSPWSSKIYTLRETPHRK